MSHPFPALQELLPERILDVNESLHVLSLLIQLPSGSPCLLAEQQFTNHEWRVLMTLIATYPNVASYARLLEQLTDYSREECKERLSAARRRGNDATKRELRPLREALASMHHKLNALSLMVVSVQRLGYRLTSDVEDL